MPSKLLWVLGWLKNLDRLKVDGSLPQHESLRCVVYYSEWFNIYEEPRGGGGGVVARTVLL